MIIDKTPLPKDIQLILENDIYGGEAVKALGEAFYVVPRNQVLGTCVIGGHTVDHNQYVTALKKVRAILKPLVIRPKEKIDMPYYYHLDFEKEFVDRGEIIWGIK